MYFCQRQGAGQNAFHLKEVCADHVCTVQIFLGASETTGLDDLSSRFIQYGATSTALMTTYIVDMFIVQVNIPDDLKRGRSTSQK